MPPRYHRQLQEDEEDDDSCGAVKLISAEGFEFIVDRKAAMVSSTLRNMLTSPGGFSETRQGEVRFPEITTNILEKICRYFYWSLHYSRARQSPIHLFSCSATVNLLWKGDGRVSDPTRDNPGTDDGCKLPRHLMRSPRDVILVCYEF